MSQKGEYQGNSLVLQWLGLCTFTTVAQVQSLVSKLRYYKLYGKAKKKKKVGGRGERNETKVQERSKPSIKWLVTL